MEAAPTDHPEKNISSTRHITKITAFNSSHAMSRALRITAVAVFLGARCVLLRGEGGSDANPDPVLIAEPEHASPAAARTDFASGPAWDVFSVSSEAPQALDSWNIISSVPVSEYWDNVKAQFRVGILGDVLNLTHPEFVTILPKTRFIDGKTEVFSILAPETSVLFMHMVHAIQNLTVRALEMKSEVDKFQREKDDFALKIIRIASQTGVEWRTAAEIRAARTVVQRRLDIMSMKLELEKSLMRLRIENQDIRHKLRKDIRDTHHRKLLDMQLEHEKALDDIRIMKQNHSLAHAEQLFLQRYADKEAQLLAKYKFELEQLQLDVELSVEALQYRVLEEQRVERENEDISLALLRARGESQLKGMEEIIKTVFLQLNSAWDFFIARPHQVGIGSAAVVAILALLVFVSELFKAGKDGIRHLVRRRDALSQVGSGFTKTSNKAKQADSSPAVDEFNLTLSEENTKVVSDMSNLLSLYRDAIASGGVAMPNLLIQGAPGNGKSSLAKLFASSSQVEYAVISGNNLRALGHRADKVLRGILNACITKAKSSSDPFFLVIDDVDAFACAENGTVSTSGPEPLQAALTYCLHMVLDMFKNNSPRFGLIATSSVPASMLHNAFLDRIDRIIQIEPPSFRERLMSILKLTQSLLGGYIPETELKALTILLENTADAIEVVVRNRIKRAESKEESSIDIISSCGRFAAASEHWTYRDLTKALMGVQCEVLGTERCELTKALWSREIDLVIKKWREANKTSIQH